MKKALVLSLAVILGLGIAAFGQITGSWSSTFVVDPVPVVTFTSMSSTLAVNYAISGWTFGSTSSFNLGGYSAQAFKVSGALGAFTFASNMSFAPMVVSEKTYIWPAALVHDLVYVNGYSNVCPLSFTATKWAPAFLKWDVSAKVTIAGVGIDVYMLNDQSAAGKVDLVNYLYEGANFTTQTNSVSCASTSSKGMGWRLKLDGSIGTFGITSLTYFNMTEMDMADYLNIYGDGEVCPVIGKSGLFTVGDGCNTGLFTEEYVQVSGLQFGCATVDVGLSIACTGFQDIRFLVSDIALGNWGTFTFAITFTLTDKVVSTCITLTPLAGPCFNVEIGGFQGTTLDELSVLGFSFSSTFGGVKFASVTELDIDSTLMSDLGYWSYLNSPDLVGFLVPFSGKKPDCLTYWATTDLKYEMKCVAETRYRLWEKFVITADADACCGGLFNLTVSTYFGDFETLAYAAYAVVPAGSLTPGATMYLYGTTGATFLPLTSLPTTAHETVLWAVGYADGSQTTLFNWAKTNIALAVGISSNVKLTFGFDLSAYGFDTFSLRNVRIASSLLLNAAM